MPARCGRSHGTPPNCSACVISCSATQRRRRSASASSCVAAWPRFGATNSSRAGASGSSTGNSYWPITRPARKPEIAPAWRPSTAPGGGAGHAAQRARALGGLRGGGLEHAADRGEVRVDPRLAVDRLGDRQHPGGRHEPRVAADERLGVVGRAHQRLERLRVARGLESGDPFGDLGCEVPIDHPPRMAGRPLRFLSAAARAPAPRGPPRSAPRRSGRPRSARRAARRAVPGSRRTRRARPPRARSAGRRRRRPRASGAA